jgi:hypothetical protein
MGVGAIVVMIVVSFLVMIMVLVIVVVCFLMIVVSFLVMIMVLMIVVVCFLMIMVLMIVVVCFLMIIKDGSLPIRKRQHTINFRQIQGIGRGRNCFEQWLQPWRHVVTDINHQVSFL